MYILKNSLISIARNKGRNILIGIIILVISCASAITLAIRNTANNLVKDYEESHDITGTISFNRGNLSNNFKGGEDAQKSNIEAFNNIESITLDDVKKYGESDNLKGYYYIYATSLNSDTLTKATDSLFIDGTYKVTDGEMISDFTSKECVISSELASLNSISVGDTITLKNPNTDVTYDFIVKGIYEDNSDSNDSVSMYSKSANKIITGSKVIEDLVADDSSLVTTVTPTFILNDENSIESFEAELTEKGLSEYYTLNTNLEELESATKSIENVKTFATTFLIICLVISAIVLFVINMINIRERKYEIGVFRTIGLSKFKLTMQFVLEIFIVSLIMLSLGAILGTFAAKPVGNILLQNEIQSSQSETEQISDNFGKGGPVEMERKTKVEVSSIDKIDAVVDITVIAELLGIGLGLTLVSCLASMISIQRFSPLTILKERS